MRSSKDKQGFHIVFTTHNSRTSQRMIKYKIKKGPPINLNLTQEIELTKIIGDIILESEFNCISYNVCKDHVHMILVCEHKELSKQVQKIKAISSKLIKPFLAHGAPIKHVPLEPTHRKGSKQYTPFWSQKFFYADLDVWQLATLSRIPSFIYRDSYLDNALRYIRNNRFKHKLPKSEALQKQIDRFLIDQDVAFKIEYID